MQNLRSKIWQAEEGKVFQNKLTGIIGCELILVGCGDSIENYEEVNKPVETPVDTSEETPTETIIEN